MSDGIHPSDPKQARDEPRGPNGSFCRFESCHIAETEAVKLGHARSAWLSSPLDKGVSGGYISCCTEIPAS